ncbi:MAG: hypothetical protein V3V09_05925 [Arenicellales bacterium]
MFKPISNAISLLALLAVAPLIQAADYTLELGMEATHYPTQGSPLSENNGMSFSLTPSITHTFEDQNIYFTFTPFARWDQRDDMRTHADIRELKAIKVLDQWELEAGISKVFWGVAEANHLVDIINQTDYLEGLDGEDKLGQPMLRISRIFEQSTLSAFILPGFREREFLGLTSRFALPFPVEKATRFESDDEEKHLDYALRFSGYAGQMDYGLSWFIGTAREVSLRPSSPASNVFFPYYAQIEQVGLDVQYTQDAWLWKLEAVHQDSQESNHSAFVAGLEYSFYGLNDGAYDLGLIAEYNQDSRDNARAALLQNDVFVGARFGFNDAESSAVLAGMILDLDDDSRSFRVEGSRRVLGDAKLSIEAQAFSHVDPNNLTYGFRDNDFMQIELTWYF